MEEIKELTYEEAVKLFGEPPADVPDAPKDHSEAEAISNE